MDLKVYRSKPVSWFDDFTHSLDHFWDTPLMRTEKKFSPTCDFHETKDYYFFSFDVPGVKKEDIQVELHNNTIYVSGEKRNEYKDTETEGKQFYEKSYGMFQRSFTLPTTVKEEAIETHFKNGVLEILIPKKTSREGRKISIKDENKNGLFSRLLKNKN